MTMHPVEGRHALWNVSGADMAKTLIGGPVTCILGLSVGQKKLLVSPGITPPPECPYHTTTYLDAG